MSARAKADAARTDICVAITTQMSARGYRRPPPTSTQGSQELGFVKSECSFYGVTMPRVSQEHRDQRRQQILAAARRCFVREGFHQTSMADILAEARLSAGAVYGHFNSKNDIIAAIAEEVIGQISLILEPIVTQEPTPTLEEAVRQALNATNEVAFGEDAFAPLAPQVWAEALRNDVLAEVLRGRYRVILQLISQLVVNEQSTRRVSPTGDP
jgi:AcrR family transcriptional regulator